MRRFGKLKKGIKSSKSRANGHGRCGICSLDFGNKKSSQKVKGEKKIKYRYYHDLGIYFKSK